MRYGKIENGNLIFAPNPIITDTVMISNPTDSQYIESGYKPIIETERVVEEGYYFTPTYTETETEINQGWEKHENEVLTEEPTNALKEMAQAMSTATTLAQMRAAAKTFLEATD